MDEEVLGQKGSANEKPEDAISTSELRPRYAWLSILIVAMAIVALATGAMTLRYVQDPQVLEESDGIQVVAFTAPIPGPKGTFHGVVTALVRLPLLEDVFITTIKAFQLQWPDAGPLEWQFMTRDGDVIVDSILRQEGRLNL